MSSLWMHLLSVYSEFYTIVSVVFKYWPDNHSLPFVTFLAAFQNKDINSLIVPFIHFFVLCCFYSFAALHCEIMWDTFWHCTCVTAYQWMLLLFDIIVLITPLFHWNTEKSNNMFWLTNGYHQVHCVYWFTFVKYLYKNWTHTHEYNICLHIVNSYNSLGALYEIKWTTPHVETTSICPSVT
jgi:hypothetical protein